MNLVNAHTLPIYQVDAFASKLFHGNPAAVCPLPEWVSDAQMQNIAAENNLSETSFIVKEKQGYGIRWFTPNTEVDLCGHATLAAAFVIFNFLETDSDLIKFHSKSGELIVKRNQNLLQMDFPALPYRKIENSEELLKLSDIQPEHFFQSKFDLLCVFKNQQEVFKAQPDLEKMAKLNYRGVIFSSVGDKTDIYSRCFYPKCGVPEDPVTGSAHCVLMPYWAESLQKKKITALQGLHRQGDLVCELVGERVILSGECQLYLVGKIYLN